MSKNVLITGGARGIGRSAARTLLSRPAGHKVYLVDVDADELEYTTHTHLKPYHPRVASSAANLADVQEIRDVVKKAADFFGGRIDVLVNNAGIARPYWPDNMTMEDPETAQEWNRYIQVNLTAPFLVTQAAIPFMKHTDKQRTDEGGCILNISSFRAHQSDPDCEGYAATKAGVIGLTHGMAVSAQKWGIRVNAILPGRITVTHECKAGDEEGKEWQKESKTEDHDRHLVNRTGKGEDIAEAIEYLMGAGFITGQELVVDGGAQKIKNYRI